MIEIFEPAQFKTIPWKNGLGETTELAINDNGSLADFDWRLSIASVSNDGAFSDFGGYQRNLVLIDGAGISLQYDAKSSDILKNKLDVATFDGASETYGKLISGPIKDFNIITKNNKVSAKVKCFVESNQVAVTLLKNSICFGFSLTAPVLLETANQEVQSVAAGHLTKLTVQSDSSEAEPLTVKLTGKNMIIVQLEVIDR